MKNIELKIEKLRKELHELVNSKGVFDEEVITKSKRLDKLLNLLNDLNEGDNE